MITTQKVTSNVQSVPRQFSRHLLTRRTVFSKTVFSIARSMAGDWNCLKYCIFACCLYCNRQVHRDFLIILYTHTHTHTHIYTGFFKMNVGVLTTCHTQYTWDRSLCIFLFNRTTLQAFVTYLTGALYVHHLWFYNHQRENRVRSKLFVACQRFAVRRHLSKLRSKRRNA